MPATPTIYPWNFADDDAFACPGCGKSFTGAEMRAILDKDGEAPNGWAQFWCDADDCGFYYDNFCTWRPPSLTEILYKRTSGMEYRFVSLEEYATTIAFQMFTFIAMSPREGEREP